MPLIEIVRGGIQPGADGMRGSALVKHRISPVQDAYAAAEAIFRDLSLHYVGTMPLTYSCGCSKAKAVGAILTLNEAEIEEIRQGEDAAVTCEFCTRVYEVTAADLDEPQA